MSYDSILHKGKNKKLKNNPIKEFIINMEWTNAIQTIGLDVSRWVSFLEKNENLIHDIDIHGLTLLETFIQSIPLYLNEIDIIHQILHILIKYGIDVNTDYTYTTTPLHEAIKVQDLVVVSMLLLHGACVDTLDDVEIQGTYQTPLHYACQQSNVDIIRILIQYGANPYEKDYLRNTPIDYIRKQNNSILLNEVQNILRLSKKRKRLD